MTFKMVNVKNENCITCMTGKTKITKKGEFQCFPCFIKTHPTFTGGFGDLIGGIDDCTSGPLGGDKHTNGSLT
jgi:hypothetical protein